MKKYMKEYLANLERIKAQNRAIMKRIMKDYEKEVIHDDDIKEFLKGCLKVDVLDQKEGVVNDFAEVFNDLLHDAIWEFEEDDEEG